MRIIHLVLPLVLLSASAWAEPPPAEKIFVGAISIEPCQEAKVLADWYSLLGFETKEFKGGYYTILDTPAGHLFFGIHRKKDNAPSKSSAHERLDRFSRREFRSATLSSLKSKGLIHPIRLKAILRKASLRTSTIQMATK